MSDNPEKRLAKEEQIETDQLGDTSQKKLKANRENAKKSTGPKTLRGKAHSRGNALKHGLFARHSLDFFIQGEDSSEYDELLKDLRDQYQPVGRAEELEVERIALCWWRLKRVWRHENSASRTAARNVGRKELARQAEYCKQLETEEDAIILRLQKAKEEIDATDKVPQDLEQILAMRPGLAAFWSLSETAAKESLEKMSLSQMFEELSPEEQSPILAELTIICIIKFLEGAREIRTAGINEVVNAQHIIPDREALDRILRYETAIERNLGRALDRLERLQRRRKGELVLPPVSVRLTQ